MPAIKFIFPNRIKKRKYFLLNCLNINLMTNIYNANHCLFLDNTTLSNAI